MSLLKLLDNLRETEEKEYVNNIVTFKDFARGVANVFSYLLRKWYWIVLSALLFGGFLFGLASLDEPTYEAQLSFVVNDSNGNGGQNIESSVLSRFGLGGGSSSGGINMDRVMAMAKSSKISRQALFSFVVLEADTMLLANAMIRDLNLKEKWADNAKLKDFSGFPITDSTEANLLISNSAIKALQGELIGGQGMVNIGFDDLSKIATLTVNTPTANLSISIAENIYKSLNTFYIGTVVQQQNETVQRLQERVDSIEREMNAAEARLAIMQDRSAANILQRNTIGQRRQERQVRILNVMYAEIIKNLETARYIQSSITPVFRVLEQPYLPLRSNRKSVPLFTATGLFLGGFLAIAGLIVYRAFRKALSEH